MGKREDDLYIIFGIVFTITIHLIAFFLFSFAENGETFANTIPGLCNGKHRCGYGFVPSTMRYIDENIEGAPKVIQAMVLPRLGLAKKNPHKLPKLQKYEQPEKVKDGINIKRINKKKKKLHKAKKKKKKQIDKKRKKKKLNLDEILDAPDDDDPRKSPTSLDKIVGNPDGSVYGVGNEKIKGNIYAGKVAIAVRKVFVVPTSISPNELKKLKVVIKIMKLSKKGEILKYKIIKKSKNKGYNLSALATVKKFCPHEGGGLRLPPPDDKTLNYINKYGLDLILDGSLLK